MDWIIELICFGMITVVFVILFVLIFKLHKKNKELIYRLADMVNSISPKESTLDGFCTETYFNQLHDMIHIYTTYKYSDFCGKLMNRDATVDIDITTEDMIDLNSDIQKAIFDDMTPQMKQYLFEQFGEKYIRYYVKTNVISLLLNHHELNIKNIYRTDNR